MTTDAVVVDVSEDWAIACDVQQRSMQRPNPVISTLSYSARCRQVRAIGGDFYDFTPLSQNRLALAIGDASGKSIPAALMILGVQASLRTAASFIGDDPAAVVRIVNSHVHATSLASRYTTLFYGVFDGNTRVLRYVNAGHNPPIVVRQDGSIVSLETGGAPVGIFSAWNYEEGLIRLHRGDLIIAYTDGITEAVNSSGEEFGLDRLRKAVEERGRQTPDEIARSIFDAMDEFSQGQQNDDATVLIAQVA